MMNKKKRIFLGITTGVVALSTALPLSFALSSCSSSKKTADYTYNTQSKTLTFNSSALFGNRNLFYGFQQLKFNNSFDLKPLVNKVVSKDLQIPETTAIVNGQVQANGWTLTIPVLNNDNVREIVINFPSIPLNEINWAPSVEVSAGLYFPNQTINTVQTYSDEQILKTIGTSLLPAGTIIDNNSKSIINNSQTLQYIVFIPDVGVSKLLIDFAPLKVPVIIPQPVIQNTNVNNNWQNIVNWSPVLPDDIKYDVLANPTGLNGVTGKVVPASYELALEGKPLNEVFDKSFGTNEMTANQNLQEDVNYFIKTYLSKLDASWSGQNILSMNVYAGNNLKIANKVVNGNLVIQCQNTSGKTQTLLNPVDLSNSKVTVNNNDIVSMVFDFNNSQMTPYLLTKDNKQQTAYLTSAFDNLSLKIYINNSPVLSAAWGNNDPVNVFPHSLVLHTLVENVVAGENFVSQTTRFNQLFNDSNFIANSILNGSDNALQDSLNTFNLALNGIQQIALTFRQDPTVKDFLQEIGPGLYNIIYAATKNKELSSLVSTLFSKQPASVFLFYNWQNIVTLLKGLNIPSLDVQLNALITFITQIGEANPTLQDMQIWVENVASLYSTLQKVLGGNQSLSWLLPLMKSVMDTLSKDPSLINLLFENIDAILTCFQNPGAPSILGQIAKGLNEYLAQLLTLSAQEISTPPVGSGEGSSNPTSAVQPKEDSTGDNQMPTFDSTKYDNIKVMDPIILANKNPGTYKSLFTCLGEALGPDKGVGKVLTLIGGFFQMISFSDAASVSNIQACIDAIFKPTVMINKAGQQTDLYTALTNNITVTCSTNNLSYNPSSNTVNGTKVWTIGLKNGLQWNLKPWVNMLNSIQIDLTKIPNLSENIKNIITGVSKNLGSILVPSTLVAKTTNNISFQYVANNAPVVPYVLKNGQVKWRYLSNVNIQINTGNILNDSKGLIWKMVMKFLKANVFNTDGSYASSQWLSTVPMPNVIINNYQNNVGIPGLSISENRDQNFKQYLESLIAQNVTWVKDPVSKKLVMNYHAPSDLNQQLATYFSFGPLFNNPDYPFIQYQTALDGKRFMIAKKEIELYTFHIYFSAPTIYRNKLGFHRLVNSLSWTIPIQVVNLNANNNSTN